MDLDALLYHELGHVMANAYKGLLPHQIKIYPSSGEAFTQSYGWRQLFPTPAEEVLERERDREAGLGFVAEGLANDARFEQRKALAPKMPLTDELLTYAAGHEAEKRYAAEHGFDIQTVEQEFWVSQDHTNMNRLIREHNLKDRQAELITRAKHEGGLLFGGDAAWLTLGEFVSEVIHILSGKSPDVPAHTIKWYELSAAIRAGLVSLSEYPFDSPTQIP